MKAYLFLIGMFPLCLLAETINLSPEVTETTEAIVKDFFPNAFVLSGIIVAVVQILKKVLSSVHVLVEGKSSQALTVSVGVLYVIVNSAFWNRGVVDANDIILLLETIVATVGGIYGYKILWRKPDATVTKEAREEA
jgi:hypothetical protein